MSKSTGGPTPVLQDLKLSTLEETRESYERIIQAFAESMISENNLRALVYALSGYLNYWRLQKDMEIEKRIEAIEEALNDGKG